MSNTSNCAQTYKATFGILVSPSPDRRSHGGSTSPRHCSYSHHHPCPTAWFKSTCHSPHQTIHCHLSVIGCLWAHFGCKSLSSVRKLTPNVYTDRILLSSRYVSPSPPRLNISSSPPHSPARHAKKHPVCSYRNFTSKSCATSPAKSLL